MKHIDEMTSEEFDAYFGPDHEKYSGNDACDVMCKRIAELLDQYDCPEYNQSFKQEYGETGPLRELDLDRFTQRELVHVFEYVIGVYHIKTTADEIKRAMREE